MQLSVGAFLAAGSNQSSAACLLACSASCGPCAYLAEALGMCFADLQVQQMQLKKQEAAASAQETSGRSHRKYKFISQVNSEVRGRFKTNYSDTQRYKQKSSLCSYC